MIQKLYDAILHGDAKVAGTATQEALDAGVAALELVQKTMVPAMDEVGRLYECEEYFVPELLLSARAMKTSMALLRPLLTAQQSQSAGCVAIGTVKGDLHDIGKNLVAALLEGGGFRVIDLGTDVEPERFVEAVRGQGANVVCLSTLLTVTMDSMRTTVQALRDAGLRERAAVLVGGAPVTAQFAQEIGADAYGESATAAVALARAHARV